MEIKLIGDGLLATFNAPARAIDCACAMRDAVRTLGIQIRIGIHTGEIELRGIYAPISGGGIHLGGNSLPTQTHWPKLTIFMDADAIAADPAAPMPAALRN